MGLLAPALAVVAGAQSRPQQQGDPYRESDFLTRGRRLITKETRTEMKKILKEIQDGSFAKEFILENQANRPVFNARLKQDANHMIETVGEKLRSMMPFVGEKLK